MRPKTPVLTSSLCDYSDACILVAGTISVNNATVTDWSVNNNNKKIIFKNCALFLHTISQVNHTQADNVKDFDVVMQVYNLTEYFNNYSKTSQSYDI